MGLCRSHTMLSEAGAASAANQCTAELPHHPPELACTLPVNLTQIAEVTSNSACSVAQQQNSSCTINSLQFGRTLTCIRCDICTVAIRCQLLSMPRLPRLWTGRWAVAAPGESTPRSA